MRTTITIDERIAARIKKLQEKYPRKTFKQIINEILEKGLSITPGQKSARFEIEPLEAEPRKNLDFDNIGRLLEIAEGNNHK